MEMNMTFPSDTSELLVHVGDKISFNVFEGKTAVFSKDDAKKLLSVLMMIIGGEPSAHNAPVLNGVKRSLDDFEQAATKIYNEALPGWH